MSFENMVAAAYHTKLLLVLFIDNHFRWNKQANKNSFKSWKLGNCAYKKGEILLWGGKICAKVAKNAISKTSIWNGTNEF